MQVQVTIDVAREQLAAIGHRTEIRRELADHD